MTSISNIRMTKARGLVLALTLALAVFLASASPAGAWFYFDTSGSYAPGKFDYSYPILTFEPLIGGGVDYHLDSGQAQLCASAYNGTQKITVQANVYKWNTTLQRWDLYSQPSEAKTVAARGCTTFFGWNWSRAMGWFTIDWKAWWQTTSGYTLAYQGLALNAASDYQVAGQYSWMGGTRYLNGRTGVGPGYGS